MQALLYCRVSAGYLMLPFKSISQYDQLISPQMMEIVCMIYLN